MTSNTSALIVGGSLNGLTTAVLLAQRHIPCIVVERHPGTTLQYKFRGISPRSMEIYRSVGIEAEIRAHDLIDGTSAYIARTKNLSDPEISWQGIPWSSTSDLGPARAATCDQDRLEPILRPHAERQGATMRFNTELVGFTQDADGVSAVVRQRATGEVDTIRASYLIAADGTHSPVREALGIARHGPGVMQHWMNVIFETDLPTTLFDRALRSVFVTDINGTFVPRGDGRWLMAVQYVPERGEGLDDFTETKCLDLIRRGAGRPDVKARIVDARPWEAAAQVADRYQDRRVFLVGDSAHVMPPTGGFGGNTGIHDAYNLAWKLDAVLHNAAGPRLLDTYDQERRPIADRTVAQALARLQAWFKDAGRKLPPPEPMVEDDAVIFGYRYPGGAFISEGEVTDLLEDPRTPSAGPGARAPHLVVERAGEEMSTVDLFAGRWVLFAGPGGRAWRAVAQASDKAFGSLTYHGPGTLRDVHARWSAVYGVGPDGAVLVRPDGMIAWRAKDATPETQRSFGRALERLSFR